MGDKHIAVAYLAKGLEKIPSGSNILGYELNQVKDRTRKEYFWRPRDQNFLVGETGRRLAKLQPGQEEDV